MKKLLSFVVVSSIFIFTLAPIQAQNINPVVTNSIENYSQFRKCLAATTIDKNKIQLMGSDIPANETVYIVDCIPTINDFVCTTGDKTADETLHISKPNTSSFSLIGSNNPTISKGGSLKINANADLTNGKIHIFTAIILENTLNSGDSTKTIKFNSLNFFDQNLAECQVDKSINDSNQTVITEPGINTPVTTVNYGAMMNNDKMFIIGKISHPFAKIEFVQNGKVLVQTTANKYGTYSILIDNRKIDQTSQIGVKYTKNPQNKQQGQSLILDYFNAHAQNTTTSSFMIDPIFSYIEGYAYDTTNKTLANATVNIKLKNSGDVYYSTTADERGFFTIAPEFLPIYAYEIEVKNPANKTVNKVQTYQFAIKNKEYLMLNKVNLVTATKNNKSLVKAAKTSISTNSPAATSVTPKKTSAMDDPDSIVFTLIILIVIVCVIGITLFFLYKNNTHDKDDKHLF